MSNNEIPLSAIVPAAGVGKRMKADCPKQYLPLNTRSILQHSVEALARHSQIECIIIAISPNDEYFFETGLNNHPKVKVVQGGKDRVDSVLAGLKQLCIQQYPWVLVHDAARPCLRKKDVDNLINACLEANVGGILANPVRDTMKRGRANNNQIQIEQTVEREQLWHALTPQMYPTKMLKQAIENALADQVEITDESSAIEYHGQSSIIVEGASDNIKVTRPADLALAEFILFKIQELACV